MSKAPKNIEKILLGVGLLAGAGLAYLGYSQFAADAFNKSAPNPRDGDVSVAGAEQIPGTINSLQSDRTIRAATVPSTRLDSGQREVNLFVGVPLFAERDNPNDPIDLLQSPDVHPPIPNEWWLKYEISPVYADSPQRDADEDGFSNLEEFTAKTLPNDSGSHPELADKLAYVKDETVTWFLEFGFQAGGKWIPKFENLTTGEKNRVPFANGLEPGDVFFGEEPFKGRFKFIEIEEREVFNERLNINEKKQFGKYEDLKENKKGTRYEVPNRIPNAVKPQYYNYDRTAVLELRALGMGGKEFKVEENTRFALPPDGDDKKYLLKNVTPEQIEIEWEVDGETRSRVIPKG
ncbi:Amuc_1099 family pilus-like system protein [Haloferula sp. A504]|uniref:Amuc_1099 family pilus-like system protein n=1 Tax=Haloferula sp. A504 TaxID=3373601 RepID=UPI0031BDD629|nr:hypothetical protein [Verrucomicrobiaceae bacterium E54]